MHDYANPHDKTAINLQPMKANGPYERWKTRTDL